MLVALWYALIHLFSLLPPMLWESSWRSGVKKESQSRQKCYFQSNSQQLLLLTVLSSTVCCGIQTNDKISEGQAISKIFSFFIPRQWKKMFVKGTWWSSGHRASHVGIVEAVTASSTSSWSLPHVIPSVSLTVLPNEHMKCPQNNLTDC